MLKYLLIENLRSINVFSCTDKVTTVIDNNFIFLYVYNICHNMVNTKFINLNFDFFIFQQHDKLNILLLAGLI